MRWLVVVLVAIVAGIEARMHGGFAFMAFNETSLGLPGTMEALADARAAGGEWVAVSVMLRQEGATSNDVFVAPGLTASVDSVTTFVEAAHAAYQHVLFKPIVVCGGACVMVDVAPSDPALWFASYARALMPYLRMAEASGVEAVSVGLELVHLSTNASLSAHWDSLVATIRGVFSGRLTYCSVFAPPYDEAAAMPRSLWAQLDSISLDFYPPLQKAGQPRPDWSQLVSASLAALDTVASWRSAQNLTALPVWLSEYGVPSRADGLVAPFANPPNLGGCATTGPGAPDAALQATAFNATLTAITGRTDGLVAKVMVFQIDTPDSFSWWPRRHDNAWACSWTPRGKEGMCVLASFFHGDVVWLTQRGLCGSSFSSAASSSASLAFPRA